MTPVADHDRTADARTTDTGNERDMRGDAMGWGGTMPARCPTGRSGTRRRAMRRARSVVLIGLALPLAGCGGDVARAFGFARNSPNEFTVTTQAPLVMPPNENLPKPTPGAPRPQDQSPRVAALETLAPDVALQGVAGASSPGQLALLDAVEARAGLPTRHGEITGGAGGIAGDLEFWHSRPSDIVVDDAAEQHRLRADAADGASPDRGPTPAAETP